jgi:xanthine dehydrogenase accessory factor
VVIEAAGRLIEEERLGAVATVVAGPDVGAKAVIDTGSGYIGGDLPADVAEDVLADALLLAEREANLTLRYGEREVFIEIVAPQPRMVIVGAVHTAEPLSKIAKELGFEVVVTDARAAFATQERFPDADRIVVGWPDDVKGEIDLDARTYVVILSHDARFEDPVLPWVLDSPVRYIGAMGSRRTHAKRVAKLEAQGYVAEQIDRIHGPVGLDIGAEQPGEVAVSIMAEIIQERYGSRSTEPLVGKVGRIEDSDVAGGSTSGR